MLECQLRRCGLVCENMPHVGQISCSLYWSPTFKEGLSFSFRAKGVTGVADSASFIIPGEQKQSKTELLVVVVTAEKV